MLVRIKEVFQQERPLLVVIIITYKRKLKRQAKQNKTQDEYKQEMNQN